MSSLLRGAAPLLASLTLSLGLCDAPPEPDRGLRRTAERPPESGYVVPPLAASATPAASAPAAPPEPAAPRTPARVAVEDKAMGTHIVLASYTGGALDEATLRGKLSKALDEIRRLEGLMTT